MFTNLPLELREDGELDLGMARTVLSYFAACGDAIILTDPQLHIHAMNSEAEALYGLRNEAYEGRNLQELVTFSLSPHEYERGMTVSQRRDHQFTPEGQQLEVEFTMFSLEKLGGKNLRAIVVRDRTTLVIALEKLFQKECTAIPSEDVISSLD